MPVAKHGLHSVGVAAASGGHARRGDRAGGCARWISLVRIADAANEHILLIAVRCQESGKARATAPPAEALQRIRLALNQLGRRDRAAGAVGNFSQPNRAAINPGKLPVTPAAVVGPSSPGDPV